jgi:hypothetical protein
LGFLLEAKKLEVRIDNIIIITMSNFLQSLRRY